MGAARADRRRRTTATAMMTQSQKPIRSHVGDVGSLNAVGRGEVVNFWTSGTSLE